MSIENYKRLYAELLIEMREFSGCPVVKTSHSNPGDVGSIPGQETKVLNLIPYAKTLFPNKITFKGTSG